MATIEVVENPRRKRRRPMTAKQRKYFGKRRTRRRRNPMLATLGNPRRRRRRGRASRSRYSRRRYRNPSIAGFDIGSAVYVGVGMIGSDLVPTLVRKVWAGLPSAGPMVYLVKAGGTFATAFAVKMVTKSPRNFNLVMAGGLGLIFVDLFRQYIAPRIGLAGLGNDAAMVYASELEDAAAIEGYVDGSASRVAGYVSSGGVGAYQENPYGAF